MDHSRSGSGNCDDNVGIPDELRCKRSDGKQWRCTAKSMPDKTVCEKHYVQAKKRAASSALRASVKKAKKKSFGESDIYLESQMDDFDMVVEKGDNRSLTNSKKKNKNKGLKNQIQHSPETTPMSFSIRTGDDSQSDTEEFEDERRSNKAANLATGNSSKNRSQMSFDASPSTEDSNGNMDSSEDAGGIACHHCRRNDGNTVFWCSRCDRRGYCDSCISQWYSDISLEDIQKACPACRGTCSCKVCLRSDILLKMKIREIPVIDKLQYLYSLLSSVLPVIQQIYQEQCSEVQLEKSLRGAEINLARAKLNADEQMCCNVCRIPIIDYHRHCTNCLYDVCLRCCKDLCEESDEGAKGTLVQNQNTAATDQNGYALDHLRDSHPRLDLMDSFPDWEVGPDGSIPCLPTTYGGCGCSTLSLSRIFKTNWVSKLVKNVEEIVSVCKVNDSAGELNVERDDSSDSTLYCPTSQDIKTRIVEFRKHWVKGKPILVKEVWDSSCLSSWAPSAILRGIQDTAEDGTKSDNIRVKAIDCLSCSEIDIDLNQFIKGYSEGRTRDTGSPELLKLKDWPSPGASEEFLLYQRAEFISKFPLLEYIHSKWGVLNVAAKLPHYSLQNDVGPRILISYGTKDELGKGGSVINLHYKMRDMVYLLAHVHHVNSEIQQISVESAQKSDRYLDMKELNGEKFSSLFHNGNDVKENYGGHLVEYDNRRMDANETDRGFQSQERHSNSSRDVADNIGKTLPGTLWDVFRREDIPKLMEYLEKNWKELANVGSVNSTVAAHHLFDEAVYLSWQHKRQLKDDFGIEPWSFEQHLGEAVFIPAGCPFQLRNLQSTVQLALDFLSPESLGVAVKLAEEVRCLPNEHEAKVQTLEVGKISLYAASSAIKEVQKLVLDPKSSAELGFEDPNLTALVSENMARLPKRKQIE